VSRCLRKGNTFIKIRTVCRITVKKWKKTFMSLVMNQVQILWIYRITESQNHRIVLRNKLSQI